MTPSAAPEAALWRYAEVRPVLLRAARLVSAREAERRVLLLENPALPGSGSLNSTLVAGLQIIVPGEMASAHRHTPNALRFVLEGEGAYTILEGERIDMYPGDFIVTPGWTWHQHGNDGTQPVIWLDGLDAPLARLFHAVFREKAPNDMPPAVDRATLAGHRCVYRLAQAREPLDGCSGDRPDAAHGYRVRYADTHGKDPIPTLAVFLQRLPVGFQGASFQSTAATLFHAVTGRGTVDIGDARFEFLPHDVFFVPSRTPYRLHAQEECLLFSYSDRAAQESLGFYRESLASALS
jgi:gentisate 1,2-dioxygenase